MIKRYYKHIKKSDNKIRVVTYNILAPIATQGNKHKETCSEECMKWSNRFKLIKKEVMNENPDIICFQEAQTDVVYDDILKYFNSNGYYGYYAPQYNPKYSTQKEEYNFGIIILFKLSRFHLMKLGTIDYFRISSKYLEKKGLSEFEKKIMRRFASVVLYLVDRKTNKDFFIVSVHLEANPLFDDIKNFQGYMLMKYIEKITDGGKIPVILAGDFNSTPKSSTYHGITTGISLNKFDTEDFKYPLPFLNTPKRYTSLQMTSCYHKVFGQEPKHTNYTFNFKNTLDYIFVSSHINIIGAMKEIDSSYLENKGSIPDDNFPSDHFMQSADIEINN